MITPWVIRVLYWITQTIIIIAGLIGIVTMRDQFSGERGIGGLLISLLLLIGGTLLLRLLFEMLIVQFKISENSSEINDKIEENMKSEL